MNKSRNTLILVKSIMKMFVLGLLFLIALNLSACREEEQGRPLKYNKGIYGGNADTTINEGKVYQLRQRASGQAWY